MIKILTLFKEFYNSKGLILKLAKNDFWAKYASSQLGILWAFAQPLMTIIVYWFIFEIGFRVVPLNNIPYILWLMCGLIPWFFFSEALGNSTNSLIEYSYLVKKVVFKVSILPSIKIISALFVHVFFMAFYCMCISCMVMSPQFICCNFFIIFLRCAFYCWVCLTLRLHASFFSGFESNRGYHLAIWNMAVTYFVATLFVSGQIFNFIETEPYVLHC